MIPVREVDDQAALTLETSGDGVAWLLFDRPDSKVNLLTSGVIRRLDEFLASIEEDVAAQRIRGVVVMSGKPGTFIAGADVNEIASIISEQDGYEAAREGQRVLGRIENLAVPTVAAIDGLCLGAGTELALACGRRIASDRDSTRIGLPEVRLGILPGFGGTTRLPRLVGLSAALPIILTGQPVSASKARRIGLVEEVMHPSLLRERARSIALEGGRGPKRARKLLSRLVDETSPGRALALSRARSGVMKETRGNYPAPLLAIETIRRSTGVPLDRAFEIEAHALGRLIVSEVSKNLIHVFRLMEGAKKTGLEGVQPRPVQRAAVLGAGVMGGGIAQLLAYNDVAVRLKDINRDAITSGLKHARGIFDRAVRKGRMSSRDADRKMDSIAPALDYSGFGNTDLVIEAIVERLDVKKSVLREVESVVGEDTILTSNTSSLSISGMQSALDRPANFCGMHFFNPVHRMPLVEVIRGEATADATIATVHALVRRLGKTPVIMNDGPGFLVNRVLSPYLNEAGYLLEEGASVEAIDNAMLDFGMPMGPLRLLDEVGLDIARHAADVMHEALGKRLRPSSALASLAGADLLGRKGGKGFYVYDDDGDRGVNPEIYARLAPAVPEERTEIPDETIRTRCVMAMVNEAARILEDGIVARPGDIDLAMITGTGFPPFRGGLLRYADSLGLDDIADRLDEMARLVGSRFATAPLIRQYATEGRGFYA
ncbi:MAG TPA: 3-hydroxyacyl-CoA dehydrogenase NAD-binding domain-containing protein [Longimicrobiales bacterium]|nr:3-hydroxyacyl-CoA dehydrogenase NAD-binding domain-containing protein [Longimicrobiales bacterium]